MTIPKIIQEYDKITYSANIFYLFFILQERQLADEEIEGK